VKADRFWFVQDAASLRGGRLADEAISMIVEKIATPPAAVRNDIRFA